MGVNRRSANDLVPGTLPGTPRPTGLRVNRCPGGHHEARYQRLGSVGNSHGKIGRFGNLRSLEGVLPPAKNRLLGWDPGNASFIPGLERLRRLYSLRENASLLPRLSPFEAAHAPQLASNERGGSCPTASQWVVWKPHLRCFASARC